jgi:hypothetical protein
MPDPNFEWPAGAPLNFGAYTSVLRDDTLFWNLGGNGLVPYGTPRPLHEGPPDLVDSIQVTRAQGAGGGPGCPPPIVDGPSAPPSDGAGPNLPAEPSDGKKSDKDKPQSKKEASQDKPGTPE